MARNITTGIDVGSQNIRVVVSERHKDSPLPHIIGTGNADSAGLRHGYVTSEEEAAAAISAALRAAERSAGVSIGEAYLSVGGVSLESIVGAGSVAISRADGVVTDLDIEKAVTAAEENLPSMRNRRIVETIPIRYKLDGREMWKRPLGLEGSKLEVKTLFITCLEQHLTDLVHAVERAGVDVLDIVPAPLAASLVALTKKQRTVGSLLVNIGAETVSMVVFDEDVPVSLEVFPIGSTDITNDIALGLRVPLEEAEKLKLGKDPDTVSKKKLSEIIEARLSDVFELIEAHLKKIGRNELLPAGIILTGGGAGIGTIEDFARAFLKLPSKVASPLFSANKNQMRDSSWFVAYGLTIYGLSEGARRGTRGFLKENAAWSKLKLWLKELLP